MARVLGESGRYVADEAQRKRWQYIKVCLLVVGLLCFIGGADIAFLLSRLPLPHLPWWLELCNIPVLSILIVLVIRWGKHRLRDLEIQRNSMERGTESEVTVGRRLVALPEEFHVINDLTTPFGNLDHVVVGPTGVFILDTKAWRGVVTPDGKGELLLNGQPTDKPFIRQFIRRMLGIRDKVRMLTPDCDPYYQPVFVFTAARVDANWGTTKSLHCIRDDQIHDYIVEKKLGERLGQAEVQKLAQAFLGLAHMERDFTDRMSTPASLQAARLAHPTPARTERGANQ